MLGRPDDVHERLRTPGRTPRRRSKASSRPSARHRAGRARSTSGRRPKLKVGGGTAGHNGLRSIEAALRSRDFLRVRIGVGKPPSKDEGADHVLSKFTPASGSSSTTRDAAEAIRVLVRDGLVRADLPSHARREGDCERAERGAAKPQDPRERRAQSERSKLVSTTEGADGGFRTGPLARCREALGSTTRASARRAGTDPTFREVLYGGADGVALPDAVRPYFCAGLAHALERCLLASSRRRPKPRRCARRSTSSSTPTALLCAWDVLPYEGLSPDPRISAHRLEALRLLAHGSGPRVVVASARGFIQKPAPGTADLEPLHVGVGQSIDRDELARATRRARIRCVRTSQRIPGRSPSGEGSSTSSRARRTGRADRARSVTTSNRCASSIRRRSEPRIRRRDRSRDRRADRAPADTPRSAPGGGSRGARAGASVPRGHHRSARAVGVRCRPGRSRVAPSRGSGTASVMRSARCCPRVASLSSCSIRTAGRSRPRPSSRRRSSRRCGPIPRATSRTSHDRADRHRDEEGVLHLPFDASSTTSWTRSRGVAHEAFAASPRCPGVDARAWEPLTPRRCSNAAGRCASEGYELIFCALPLEAARSAPGLAEEGLVLLRGRRVTPARWVRLVVASARRRHAHRMARPAPGADQAPSAPEASGRLGELRSGGHRRPLASRDRPLRRDGDARGRRFRPRVPRDRVRRRRPTVRPDRHDRIASALHRFRRAVAVAARDGRLGANEGARPQARPRHRRRSHPSVLRAPALQGPQLPASTHRGSASSPSRSPSTRRRTSSARSTTSPGTCTARSRWTVSCVATSATGRPRSPCARRSRRSSKASRSPCSCRRRCSRSSTTRRSPSASVPFPVKVGDAVAVRRPARTARR